MPGPEEAFIARLRQQLKFLRNHEYAYNVLHVYVSGIADPWVFGPDDEFEFDGVDVLVVRTGPTRDHGNADVPEYTFPIRHVVATELALDRG